MKKIKYENWLEARRAGIGGSDVSAVLGLNRWKSPIELYLEKIGEVKKEVNNEYVYWGSKLEDLVADEFMKRTGKKVQRCNFILQHDEHDFLLANVDRLGVGENFVLECKTASAWKSKEFADEEIPQEYLLQVQHYLSVTGYDTGYIAVLIGGNDFRIQEVKRDNELIAIMTEQCRKFWEMVQNRQMPEVDGSNATAEALKLLYPEAKETEETLSLPTELEEQIQKIETVKEKIKELETEKNLAENILKKQIGDYPVARTSHFLIEWKNMSRKSLDGKALKTDNPELYNQYVKESSYRTFKIKQIAE